MKTPVKIAFLTVLVAQTLAVILMFPLGHAGLTLSTALGACLNAALLFWFLQRGRHLPAAARLAPVPRSKLVVGARSCSRAIAAMRWRARPTFWLHASLWAKVGRLAWVVAAGALGYFGTLWLLGFRLPISTGATARLREPGALAATSAAPADSSRDHAQFGCRLRCGQRGFMQSAYRYSACSVISKPRSRATLFCRFSISAS